MSVDPAVCQSCGVLSPIAHEIDWADHQCQTCGAKGDWRIRFVTVSTEERPLATDRASLTVYRFLGKVDREMRRQDEKYGPGRHMSDAEWFAIFMTEVGEIARALCGIAPTGHGVSVEIVHATAVLCQWGKDRDRS